MKTVAKIVIGVLLVLFAVVGALIVVMNFLPEQGGVVSTTAEVEAADPLAEEAPVVALDVGVTETENDVRVFNFTLEDFIASYNGYYWQDEGVRYLLAAEDWPQENLAQTVQSAEPATRYYYRADAEKWTLPQLRVTVPEGSDKVEEVAVCYDEHSYSEASYALFEKDCFYTLKTFFPELDDRALTEIVETVNQSSYDHTFLSSQQYRPGTAQLPPLLYHRDGIAVFGYFAIGAPAHFCVIPVDNESLANYAASGVDVREIG